MSDLAFHVRSSPLQSRYSSCARYLLMRSYLRKHAKYSYFLWEVQKMVHIRASRSLILFAVLGMLAVSLTGCGIGAPATAVTAEPAAIGGKIFGGQTPIVGAVVSLVAAGTTGYGSATSVLAS